MGHPLDSRSFTHCYVDESIHDGHGFAVTAMVFAGDDFEGRVAEALVAAGLKPFSEEYKSSARMDSDRRMGQARESLLQLLSTEARLAIVAGPFYRPRLGRQVLQALQSVVIRNAIEREGLQVFFDREVFSSEKEATRLQRLFNALQGVVIHAQQDSKLRLGIQAADAVAHSFGQIIKEAVSGSVKMVDVGGKDSGYASGTVVPLGWELLMRLRYSLLTRPVVFDDSEYPSECDPAVLAGC
jgi:hypothetical protein